MEAYPRGHFCNFETLPNVYLFSRRMNPLDYDPTYPKNPQTLAQYIRKYRKEKRLLVRELAEELGIHEFTLIKWEGGRLPHPRYLEKLKEVIPEIAALTQDSYQKIVG